MVKLNPFNRLFNIAMNKTRRIENLQRQLEKVSEDLLAVKIILKERKEFYSYDALKIFRKRHAQLIKQKKQLQIQIDTL